ncbi:hypothetical protein BpHYR1_045507 [Brachionus plicatilis]|uniref:Uncharacterized protein n=1 Tax=Brachionus plicatilis TaxID=10195 RepID=A0A3M7QGJ9_BRAPC|nr:hypothetical protein BpHYR1_045507 [Brachionus plicatilis]
MINYDIYSLKYWNSTDKSVVLPGILILIKIFFPLDDVLFSNQFGLLWDCIIILYWEGTFNKNKNHRKV